MSDLSNRYAVVYNPNACGGLGKDVLPQISAIMEKYGLLFDLFITHRRRHAMVIVRQNIRDGYRNFIAVGGDGTINEVVNGMMSQKKLLPEMKLGVVMVGTGNDWGKMFNIPDNYDAAIQIIKNNNIFRQDVGKVTFFLGERLYSRYFINVAGLGFDAKVVQSVNRKKDKKKASKLSYLTSLFTSLMKYKALDINVSIEGKPFANNKLFTMSIGIGKYSGGGMMQVPDAIADDGLFDIMMVSNISKFKIIRKVTKLYDGTIATLKEVIMSRGKQLSVHSKDMIMLEVDGESLGHGPFEFTIEKEKLNVIVG
ncbi:MAG: diacylglycerol kinase family lipid kinase [Bacteroidales bacterium]|nr:diacylglycerol kinase family lipid kinase [Bacteroidales bacterium]